MTLLTASLAEVYAAQVRAGRLVEVIEELRAEPAEQSRPPSRRKETTVGEG